ncbi:hypothetical protein HZS_7995 [Henneguya salminicola]|nr:hypothetical protein HZS_7995 [Henneguya salminicola]
MENFQKDLKIFFDEPDICEFKAVEICQAPNIKKFILNSETELKWGTQDEINFNQNLKSFKEFRESYIRIISTNIGDESPPFSESSEITRLLKLENELISLENFKNKLIHDVSNSLSCIDEIIRNVETMKTDPKDSEFSMETESGDFQTVNTTDSDLRQQSFPLSSRLMKLNTRLNNIIKYLGIHNYGNGILGYKNVQALVDTIVKKTILMNQQGLVVVSNLIREMINVNKNHHLLNRNIVHEYDNEINKIALSIEPYKYFYFYFYVEHLKPLKMDLKKGKLLIKKKFIRLFRECTP